MTRIWNTAIRILEDVWLTGSELADRPEHQNKNAEQMIMKKKTRKVSKDVCAGHSPFTM